MWICNCKSEFAITKREFVITSDFAITVDKLNEKRKNALHSVKLKSSARNCIDNFAIEGGI